MKRLILFFAASTLLFSCQTKPEKFDADNWYSQTKDFIIKDSNLPADSTSTEDEIGWRKEIAYKGGRPIRIKWFHPSGEPGDETYFSRDGQFELRSKICKNGQLEFEGIFYRGDPYGLSTWWLCDTKTKQEEGVRFRNKRVGIWKTWIDEGEPLITDYKNAELIDSLQFIKF
jgi:hypothetical protein